jgi:hypothetical protein
MTIRTRRPGVGPELNLAGVKRRLAAFVRSGLETRFLTRSVMRSKKVW